ILESGGKFALPATNASGGDPGYANATNPTVSGKMTHAALFLLPLVNPDGSTVVPNGSTCTRCPYIAVHGCTNPVQVVLQQARGRLDGGLSKSSGKYHAAYINGSWAMGKHATLKQGLRSEQQRLIGNLAEKLFNDMWTPRIGFIVDPKGARKNKIYANYGRYA